MAIRMPPQITPTPTRPAGPIQSLSMAYLTKNPMASTRIAIPILLTRFSPINFSRSGCRSKNPGSGAGFCVSPCVAPDATSGCRTGGGVWDNLDGDWGRGGRDGGGGLKGSISCGYCGLAVTGAGGGAVGCLDEAGPGACSSAVPIPMQLPDLPLQAVEPLE